MSARGEDWERRKQKKSFYFVAFAIMGKIMVKDVNFLCKLCANFWVKNTQNQ